MSLINVFMSSMLTGIAWRQISGILRRMKVWVVERTEIGLEKVFKSYDDAVLYVSKDSSRWELNIREFEVE